MKLCLRVQFYEKECKGAYLCTTEHDDAQQVVGVLAPEKYPEGYIKHTIGFGTPKFGE